MTSVRDAVRAIGATFALMATEATAGVKLIEAVDADKFETELRYVTRDDEERADVRASAILVAKSGITSTELESAIRAHVANDYRGLYELEKIRQAVDAAIERVEGL